jgi:hypothetical protein
VERHGTPPRLFAPARHNAKMSTNLLKLAVGCDSVKDLTDWIEDTRLLMKRLNRPYEQFHTTRMTPKKIGIGKLEGVSLYWVIKKQIQCRQIITEIRPFVDQDGISRCHLVLEPIVHPVRPRPMRPFQGWRYLTEADSPPDLAALGGHAAADMPEELRRELAGLGLL